MSKKARLAKADRRRIAFASFRITGTRGMTERQKQVMARIFVRHLKHCRLTCATALNAISKALKATDK